MKPISKSDAKKMGLDRYFTGLPCLRGHISERYVSGGNCIACRLIQERQRREKTREKRRLASRKYYYANRERLNKKRKENYRLKKKQL